MTDPMAYLIRCARRYPTPQAFREAVERGDLIRRGEYLRVEGLAVSGRVVGEGKVAKWPAWLIRRPNGNVEPVIKSHAIHMHGCATLEALHPKFKWPETAEAKS